jgi:5-bromo-4-chloroindolyl phosphate hydrolysis protein
MVIFWTVVITLFVELIAHLIYVFFKSQQKKREEILSKISYTQETIYTLQRDMEHNKRKIMDIEAEITRLRKNADTDCDRILRLETERIDDMAGKTTATVIPSPKRRRR